MKVTYFSWLRTKTGVPAEDVPLPDDIDTMGELISLLGQTHPALQELTEQEGSLRCTVNRRYVDMTHPVTNTDEVTIFPPVTGG
ncbi:MAG: molybdopterin converting factor subunit 1 [Pseudomonadota bacterium]